MEFKKYNIILMVVIIPLLLLLSNRATGVTSQTQSQRTISSAFSQGKERYKSGDYKSALKLFLKAVKSEPTNWLPYNWLGWTYLNLKKYEDAIIQFKISNNLKEASSNYKGLGESYSSIGDYDTALAHYKKYAEMEPNNYHPYNRLGWTYYNLKKYEDAIIQFKISNNLKEVSHNYKGLGNSYTSIGDYDTALVHYKRYAEMNPNNSDPYSRLGWAYYNLKKYEDAIIQFKTSNNLKENSDNYRGLGMSYSAIGDYENAETAISNALKTARDGNEKVKAEYNLASIYVMQGKYRKAYDILGKKPYLGIALRNVKNGIEIVKVTKGSPASLAGLRSGDILTNFGGNNLKGITSEQFVKEIVKKAEFGSNVKIQIERDGLYLKKNIPIGITPYMGRVKKEGRIKADQVKKEKGITGVRWAVIIGISNYQDTQIPSLRYATRDAKAFYNWAISPDGGKYAPSHVKLLIDKNATGANIKKALFEWLRRALIEDMVTIYFAGHGSPESPDSRKNLFLLPYDTQYSSIATTGFPMWDIETALKRFIKAKKVIVIADACHSGGVGISFDIARRSNRGIKVNPISSGMQNLSQVGDGICVISASSDNQFSQESNKWGGGHGVFTYFLLKGLRGDADYNKDSSVSIGELTSYLSEQVRRETKNAQSPTVAGRYDPALTIGRR
jgi:tetratricopeptide (TPR) repeat protein